MKVKVLTANSTNDVQQVTKSLAKDVDGIYIPTDNTFASAASVIGEVAKETKTPIVAGSVDQVKEGGLATVGIDYEELGRQTGEMAAKILAGKKRVNYRLNQQMIFPYMSIKTWQKPLGSIQQQSKRLNNFTGGQS